MAHHRAVTLAASCWAIFTAESAGSALHVLTSMMMLFLCASARPQPPAGGAGVLLSRRRHSDVPSTLEMAPDGPAGVSLCVCGVLVAGRPPLGGGVEELTGFFDGGKQHHRLLEIVRELVAVVQTLIALGPVTAVGIDRRLRRAVEGKALSASLPGLLLNPEQVNVAMGTTGMAVTNRADLDV